MNTEVLVNYCEYRRLTKVRQWLNLFAWKQLSESNNCIKIWVASYIRRIKRGERILVMKHARPALVITTYETAELLPRHSKKYYTLDDIRKLQTKGGDKNISKKVDRIVYGV